MLRELFQQLPPPPEGKTGWPWTYTEEADKATPAPQSQEALPKLTLITPTWNQADFIEETLRSVILQGYPQLEYIVMDGASTDTTPQLLEKYSPWITYWESTPDKGQSHAINKGLARATGDVINWLNSDDYYTPGTLLAVGRAFAQDAHILAVGGYGRLFGNGPDRLGQGTDIHPHLSKTIGWARIDQPETFFRAKAVAAMGPVETTLRYCMDRDWWLKYLLHFGQKGFQKLDRLVVNFRLHPASKTESEKQGFFEERDTIFYHLALAYGQDELAKHIMLHGQVVPREGYAFNCSAQPDPKVLTAALHYFLYALACEAYAAQDCKRAATLFSLVADRHLLPEDAAQLRRLRFRNRWLPTGLLAFLRKLLGR